MNGAILSPCCVALRTDNAPEGRPGPRPRPRSAQPVEPARQCPLKLMLRFRKAAAMVVRRLEHYNIRTTRFAETVKFYDDALAMKVGRAPMAPADAPATWIFDDSGTAVVHL